MAVCYFHQDRPGVGVCMRCRQVVCATCCTRLDGVNHCHACLKALASRTPEPGQQLDLWPLASVAVLGLSWLLLLGVCWLLEGRLAP